MRNKNLTRLVDGRAILCVLAALLLGYVWISSYYQLQTARIDAIDSVKRDANNYARIIDEHTSRTILSADQASIFLANRFNEVDMQLDLHEFAQSGMFVGDMINQVAIIDAKGDLAISTLPSKKINLSDREHFRVHAVRDSGRLFISKPVLGRVSQKWSIQLTRRANLPDGNLHGVVVISLDPFYFTRFYEDIKLGASGLITVARDDGTVVARRTQTKSDTGQDISKGEAFRAALEKGRGDLVAVSTLDKKERIFAYRKLRDYPLVVLVGMGLEDALQPYEIRRAETIRLATIISLLVLSFTAFAVFMYGRLLASQKQAIASNATKSALLLELEARQAELKASSSSLNAILENAADAIITTNEHGEIESFNHAAEQIFGYPAQDIIRSNFGRLTSAFDKKNWLSPDSRSFPLVLGVRQDGQTFPLELTTSKINLLGQDKIILIARDITARRKVERLQQEFVSTVSHELRTPLTAIRGSLGLLAGGVSGQLPETAKRMITLASANTDRLTRLINDLLDVQKLESGVLSLSLEQLAIAPLIQEAIDANQEYARRCNVQIVCTGSIPEANIEVDAARFQQVMANLLSNACKFSEADAKVEIRVQQIEQSLRIEVQDYGQGIPEDFRDRMFQKFSQADGSATKSKGGSGLGLSITKAIVNQMQGEIGYTSIVGQGSCFYICFPIAA